MAKMKNSLLQDIESLSRKIDVDFFRDKSILITGATGLIGSTVALMFLVNKELQCDIYLMSRDINKLKKLFEQYSESDRLNLLQQDVSEPIISDLEINYIFDCASLGNPKAFRENPVDVITANVIGVNNLINYGRKHGLKKMVYVSSGEVYGEGNNVDFKEHFSGYVDLSNVRSCYPTSKRAAESLCIAYSVQYGIDVSIARPCHVFGPNFTATDDRAYAQFIRKAARNEDIILKSTGTQVRSWLYVVDCAYALIFLMTCGVDREAYNISPLNEALSIKDFASLIAQSSGVELKMEIDNISVQNAVITRGVLDSSKLHALGWKNNFDIKTGIIHSLNTIKK